MNLVPRVKLLRRQVNSEEPEKQETEEDTRTMKLISEEIIDVQFITEDSSGKKSHFIEGVFLQSDIRNRNGRMYPFDTLDREVSKYNENYIQRGRALG